jgi:hypothetical protein
VSGPARLLAGIAAWTGVGVLCGAVWAFTVGGVPPIWVAILLGAVGGATLALGPGWLSISRTPPKPQAPANANPDRIAVLEHELLGIQPEPGTPAARAVALAKPVDPAQCPHDHVIDVTQIQHTRPIGMCEHCGAEMVGTDEGHWEQP